MGVIRKQVPIEKLEDGWVLVSTGVVDRESDRVLPSGALLENYQKNPVVMWGHNYRDPWALIGRAAELEVGEDGIRSKPEFREPASESDPMHVIQALWEQGLVRAASIGFRPIEWTENEKGGRDFTSWELLEWSLVPVPANQEALRLAVKAMEMEAEMEGKSVIPYRRYPLADREMSWDGPAQMRQAEAEVLRRICAWYDAENPDVKSSYKLPHHLAASGHSTVWRGVVAAMTALLGGRGGVDIPAADRRGVYNHLARHYRDFDEEPPEFRVAPEGAEADEDTPDAEARAAEPLEQVEPVEAQNVDAGAANADVEDDELTPDEQDALAVAIGVFVDAVGEILGG